MKQRSINQLDDSENSISWQVPDDDGIQFWETRHGPDTDKKFYLYNSEIPEFIRILENHLISIGKKGVSGVCPFYIGDKKTVNVDELIQLGKDMGVIE